jgi:shikimate 5-dehydrogenase
MTYRLGPVFPVTIVTRRIAPVEKMIGSWSDRGWRGPLVRVVSWTDPLPPGSVLVLAGLPLDFAGSPQVARLLSGIDPESTVVDLNYGRSRTPVRDQAHDLGLAAHDGIGLLVHQATLSLSLWLGEEVSPGLLEEALLSET